ncbi:hypothetical protein B7740_21630 [Mycobacterium tuberculosis]|nr:hypothetical protein B7740_21630 [Mycobacterium tuberculosis]
MTPSFPRTGVSGHAGAVQAFLVVPASHSAVASLTSSMHRQGLPRLINSDLEATLTARALS